MSNILVLPEGHYLDDTGTVIVTNFVDARDNGNRTPIVSLIKSSPSEYAIERCGTVHVGTLEYYREHVNLDVRDPGEGYASRSLVRENEVTDDPTDLANRQLLIAARNRGSSLAAEELQGGAESSAFNVRITQGSTTTRRRTTTTKSTTYGKNGWIFCTTIVPRDRQGHTALRMVMGDRDHTSFVRSPRNFARALAEMTAYQLGPQCQDVDWQGKIGGRELAPRSLPSQAVFHGPVVYVEDVYKVISGASSDLERMLLPIFTKHIRYRNEREYRFFIFTKEEPHMDCVNLRVSPELMAAMKMIDQEDWLRELPPEEKCDKDGPEAMALNEESSNEPEVSEDLETLWDPLNPLDLLNDPRVTVVPKDYMALGLPDDLAETTAVYGAVQALRTAVESVSAVRRVEVSSAAWYAESYVRRLCARFENPVAGIAIKDSNDIVIRLNFPPESEAVAATVVSPQGTAVCRIQRATGVEVKHDERSPLLRKTTLSRLAELGMALRSTATMKGEHETS